MTVTPLLSASEMDACQALQERTMTNSCQIRRATSTSDGMGGTTDTWATAATVICRVGPPARGTLGTERVVSDRLAGETIMVVTLPAGTDVRRTDRLQVDNGVTYEAMAVLAPHTFETARQILSKAVS